MPPAHLSQNADRLVDRPNRKIEVARGHPPLPRQRVVAEAANQGGLDHGQSRHHQRGAVITRSTAKGNDTPRSAASSIERVSSRSKSMSIISSPSAISGSMRTTCAPHLSGLR